MENASKSLLIAGAILIAILLISMGIFIYNNTGSMAASQSGSEAEKMKIIRFNNEYTMYEGRQNGSNVKRLLQSASLNNSELYNSQDTIQDCVCIRTKSKEILNQIKDAEFKRGLTTREYGVRYPSNIKEISKYIMSGKNYDISFNYNKRGYIWEIWINEP